MGKLTPWQVHHLYFCERDKYGSVVIPADDAGVGPDEMIRIYAQAIGLKPHLVERLVGERREKRERAVKESRERWQDRD